MYTEKANSRPNAPVNVIVGALILKEFIGLSDDEMLEEYECDFRYRYALHTMSYAVQPISDRTFSRFRERNAVYELATGIDLIHTCMVSLAEVELQEGFASYADPDNRSSFWYRWRI